MNNRNMDFPLIINNKRAVLCGYYLSLVMALGIDGRKIVPANSAGRAAKSTNPVQEAE